LQGILAQDFSDRFPEIEFFNSGVVVNRENAPLSAEPHLNSAG